MVLRRGNVALFAAVAGMGKTMVMLNAVINMGVPTLVFSSDSDDMTVAQRLISIRTNRTTDQAEAWIASDPTAAAAVLRPYRAVLKWQFNPNPTLDDIWLNSYAYLEAYGDWPQLIVIDIMSDVSHDGKDEWSTLREVLRQSKVLARETNACVLLIHHCTEGVPETRVCPTRGDVMGKISAQPALMVTFGQDPQGGFWAACVKNRFGPSKKNGENRFRMNWDPERSKVSDWVEPVYAGQTQGEEWWK
jgi:DnaB helicase-like protein